MRLDVKVVPGASRDAVAGWLGDALKLRVRAAPEKGKANKAVIELLARTLDVDARAIVIERGHGQARKTLRVEGLSEHELQARLEGLV